MKKYIGIVSGLVILLFLSVRYIQSNNISRIMNDYDTYEEQLSASGLNIDIEPSDTKIGEYLNGEGNVLTITSSDQMEYIFYKVNHSNNR